MLLVVAPLLHIKGPLPDAVNVAVANPQVFTLLGVMVGADVGNTVTVKVLLVRLPAKS